MQIANIMLALGGDKGNTVPKLGVTAAEIPVLQVLHGEDAVTEIRPTGDISRSNRDERARLLEVYAKWHDGKDISPVSVLYPGAAARVFERFDELVIPEEFYAAEKRATPAGARSVESDLPALPAGPVDIFEEPDGIEEMSDKRRAG